MSQSKAPRVTIPVVKRKFDLFRVDYTMYRGNEECLWMLVCEAIYNIASRHARPGRGDDRDARGADAPTSRRNSSCGFARDLGARAPRRRTSESHSFRVSIFRHHAHITTDCGADRVRDALKIREGR